MNKLFSLFLLLMLLSGCYYIRPGYKKSYKWVKTTEELYGGKIEVVKSKNLRRKQNGTAGRHADIRIEKIYDSNGKLRTKTIILTEAGGCYIYRSKQDTINNRFPKLFLRRMKYLIGF